jgi:hypothetical protein
MPMGMYMHKYGCVLVTIRYLMLHIGVGFVVARSTEMGNAKASKGGTSDKYDSHAFRF